MAASRHLAAATATGASALAGRMAGEDLSQFPELRDVLVAAQRLPGARGAILNLRHVALRLRGARPEVVLMAEPLARIRQPALLICGSRGAFGGADTAEEAARTIPHAALHREPGAGHVPGAGHPGGVGAAAGPFLHGRGSR